MLIAPCAVEWLAEPKRFSTVGELREALRGIDEIGVNPEDFWALGESLPYRVDVIWSEGGEADCYDVVFRKRGTEAEAAVVAPFSQAVIDRHWSAYANYPLHGEFAQTLVTQLRNYLTKKLPEYMVPPTFVRVDCLPRLSSGKVNHDALSVLDSSNIEHPETFVAPQTPTEKQLAAIWEEYLDLERVGTQDSFFELGGHSLLATRVIARVHTTFNVEMPLHQLFESPTIADLARWLEAQSEATDAEATPWAYLVPIQTGGSQRPFFLVPGGGGGEEEFTIYARCIYLLGEDQPVYGLQARGIDGESEPHASVEEMAADYITELQMLQPSGPYVLGGECVGGIVAFEMAQQLITRGQGVARLILMNTLRPGDVSSSTHITNLVHRVLQRRRIRFYRRKLRRLPVEERWSYISAEASTALKILLAKFGKNSSIAHVRHVREEYIKTLRRYRPLPYPGRIDLLVSEDYYGRTPAMGWDDIAVGSLENHMLPGNRNSYLGEHVQATAKQLKTCLDEIRMAN